VVYYVYSNGIVKIENLGCL